MGDEGVVRRAGRAGTAPQTLLPCLGVTHMWENLKRASKLMLRSKTFMVPGWDGPTASPQGCKLQGEGGSGGIWSPPKLPSGAGGEPRSCRGTGRRWELPEFRSLLVQLVQALPAVAWPRGPWSVTGLLQGQGNPQGCHSGVVVSPGESLKSTRCRGRAVGSWKCLCAR